LPKAYLKFSTHALIAPFNSAQALMLRVAPFKNTVLTDAECKLTLGITMEDFKRIVKMRTGGSVSKAIASYEKRERKGEMSEDIAQDKSMIKKGVRQHEAALHKGEPKTELKLKKGGRAKKEGGCVGRYKTGGTVENQYAAKKTDKDIKDIANTKRQKPAMLCGGKSVNKYQAGGMVSVDQKLAALEQQRAMEKMKRAKMLGAAQQSELIKQSPAAAGLTLPAPAGRPAMAPSAPVADVNGMPMKKGGKAKKC
jgi:hypothetical protein